MKLCFALACCVCAVACASHAQTYSYAVASENLMTADELYPSKSSSKVAFSGIDLSQWRVAGGALRGAYCASSNPNGLQAYAYHEYRTNGIYDVQLQGQDGGNIKGVKVRLWQVGGDVKVQALDAAYAQTGDGFRLGVDFDLDRTGSQGVATAYNAAGYGVMKLVLARLDSDVAAADVYAEGDEVMVTSKYSRATIDASSAFSSAVPAMKASVGSRLALTNLTDCSLGDVFRGNGEFRLEATESAAEPFGSKFEGWNCTQWTTLASNALLSDVTNVTADALYYFASSNTVVKSYYFVNNGLTARVQMQCADSDYVRCIIVDLRQSGANIQAKMLSPARYQYKKGLGYDFERQSYTGTIGIQGPGSGYGLWNLGVAFPSRRATVNLTASLRYAAATNADFTVGRNVVLKLSGTDVPPYGGKFTVLSGGRLFPAVTGPAWYGFSGGHVQYEVLESGELFVPYANFSSSYSTQKFHVRGGTVHFTFQSSSAPTDDSGNYLNFITLQDGARLVGRMPRVGYQSNPIWKVRGSSPSFIDSGILLAPGNTRTMTLDVADVTRDAAADLHIGYKIADWPNESKTSIKKTGSGTVSVECPCSYAQPTYVTAGTWLLAANATTAGTMVMSLGGGTLAAAASTTNAFAALNLTANSMIALGEGASLSFADTSATAWTSGVQLSVTGDMAKAELRFGSSSAGLTAEQLACVRVNGKKAVLDEGGRLLQYTGGLLVIFK